MSYVNKVVLNGAEVQLNSLEGLQDAAGHNRFIEGAIETETISGVTFKYARWSLSGTHLMLVLAFDIANETVLADAAYLGYITIPEWVGNKIFTLWGTENVSMNEALSITTGQSYQYFKFYLAKVNSTTLQIRKYGSETSTGDRTCRVQFDLLIDNASA